MLDYVLRRHPWAALSADLQYHGKQILVERSEKSHPAIVRFARPLALGTNRSAF
jgi:hypothetical protein